VSDSVAVDAKRILLRYGAPIVALDEIDEADRIALAREVSRTPLAERGDRLRALLVDRGLMEPAPPRKRKSRKS
jgi:hypothetical protein